jgi:molecular chaperone GrpE
MSSPDETNEGPVIRDLRRIDPATGQVRGPSKPRGKHAASKPGGTSGVEASGVAGASGTGSRRGPAKPDAGRTEAADRSAAEVALAEQLAERTADLQRVSAEYANYRKRVERDRAAVREQALANLLYGLVPVLDDIGRAREHGELVGGFKSVAESLEATVAKLGLESFGENGEPFDPKVHEALMHSYSPDVTEPTCVQILQPGYRVGERILRPARVAVAEPGDAGEPDGQDDGPEGPEERSSGPDEKGGPARIHHQPGGTAGGSESRAAGRPETSADDD